MPKSVHGSPDRVRFLEVADKLISVLWEWGVVGLLPSALARGNGFKAMVNQRQ
jgi:hypothetical protein